ncbi:hypothetical protein IAR50_001386 [Cryptococcus sp. DSM 104548]
MPSSMPPDDAHPRPNPTPAYSFNNTASSNAVAGPSSHAGHPASPAPDAGYFDYPPRAIDIPVYSPMDTQPNAIAGPSSEGALPRRRESDAPPVTPSSAPPVPSAIAVMHPSRYIHTHHPRRASLIPLGLNVISPVSPEQLRERESINPARNVGFQPNYTLDVYNALQSSPQASRRDSIVSTTSTLTLSRPTNKPPQQPQPAHPFYPPNWSSGRRRSSLTPSISAVSPPSPTRAVASGRSSRPLTSDGAQPPADARDSASGFLYSAAKSDLHARRGSLPHIGHRNWAGPSQRSWNPTLPPSRGSVDHEDTLPSADFKFGSGPSPAALSAFAGSPRGKEPKKQEDLSVFEQAEAEEAERQRYAFMAATYGADGQRARERLSIGGQSGYSSGYSSAGNGAGGRRRQSLMMWERMGLFRGSGDESAVSAPVGPTHSTHMMETAINDDDLGPRRGSLPVAIPGGLSRNESRREARVVHLNDSPQETVDNEEDEEEAREDLGEVAPPPKRPLPPLLPLSDPGPRLLPSTLALHRANHLLNARNLQSDPLPPPLPPSLHPPDPVDVTEFDIDFILAGSSAQLGGQQLAGTNAPVDVLGGQFGFGESSTVGAFQLGREEEDTFAKFVGQFDDEYGGRRGEWTFRSCRHGSAATVQPHHDPLDTTNSAREPKAEWESSGAGKYELFASGDVRSIVTGRTWRVKKVGAREYELEEVKPWTGGLQPTVERGERFSLAGKNVHRDQGGVKLPYFDVDSFFPDSASRPSLLQKSSGAASKLRASMSEAIPQVRSRTSGGRSDSESSSATASGLSQSLSNGLKTRKKDERTRALRDDILFGGANSPNSRKSYREAGKEPESGEKKDRSLGGVLKRGLSNLKNSSLVSSEEKRLAREERDREREKVQAHSWSGPSLTSGHHNWSPHSLQAKDAVQDHRVSAGNLDNYSHLDGRTIWEEEQSTGMSWIAGKGWDGVPDDAVAMIIPLDGEASVPGTPTSPAPLLPQQFPGVPKGIPSGIKLGDTVVPHPFFTSGLKQALLVWYVPFNSEHEDEPRPSTASSKSSSTTGGHSASNETPLSGSIPKFQRLLRRKASREGFKRDQGSDQPDGVPNAGANAAGKDLKRSGTLGQPLPFRSFRVVARVVNCKDMKSGIEGQEGSTSFEPVEWSGNGASSSRPSTDALQFAPNEGPTDPTIAPFLSLDPPSSYPSPSDGPTVESPALPSGRSFPTVIAVCHSRSQGVEFVLEGLDRLGLCKGESAWGPTGYEEWRGTGLSEHGREMVDLLWAGCTGVMGLMGA